MIPRKSTETLVHAVVETYNTDLVFKDLERKFRIVDLGCGSGCIILSILKFLPTNLFYGVAIDISQDALDVAKLNARELGVDNIDFYQSDFLTEELDLSDIDIIVCNPPYLDSKLLLKPQYQYLGYEPKVALFSRTEMEFYNRIARFPKSKLKHNLYVVLETGARLADPVIKLFLENGWKHVKSVLDESGFNRCQIFK